ncbi:MAG: hypothetical protein QF911_07435, partial [Candidatus Thalassarchaeaceae archaeon]|nr:hypothetical protein [Candidatus Thalassarchaeaceae archaeon]
GDGYSDAHESASSSLYCGTGDPLDDTVRPDDNDVDGLCDTNDDDDDDDGYSDAHEVNDCGTDPFTSYDVVDFDADGICDIADDDDDGDGVDDGDDWRPYNSAEWADTDGDGTGDNEDDDADGDGWLDSDDVDITDRCSSVDTDGDGLTDDYNDCSSIGFHTSINKDEGDNAGDGFSDGGMLGITDD